MHKLTVPHNRDTAHRDALLIVDAPNVDATLGDLLDRRPTFEDRHDIDVLVAWASSVCGRHVEPTLFTNISQPVPTGVVAWIRALHDHGWSVYARPKVRPDDDIDDAMVDHLRSHPWGSVVVFSHDARCFAGPLSRLAAAGTAVTVVGFTECAGSLPHLDSIDYVDVADIDGLYTSDIPRLRLADLPVHGAWVTPKAS